MSDYDIYERANVKNPMPYHADRDIHTHLVIAYSLHRQSGYIAFSYAFADLIVDRVVDRCIALDKALSEQDYQVYKAKLA